MLRAIFVAIPCSAPLEMTDQLADGSARRGRRASILVATANFVLLTPFLRLDFDRHHDGYMITVAAAVRDGHTIHTGVLSQYGPLTTWTQIPFTFLPLSTGIALRVWAAVILSLTTLVISEIGRHTPQSWGITHKQTLTAAVVWASLNPTWLGLSLHPWSSLLVALILTTALLSFVRSLRQQHSTFYLLLTGFLIGLAPFARINAGAAAILSLVIFTVVMRLFLPHWCNGAHCLDPGWNPNKIVVGLGSGVALISGVLVAQGALRSFFQQSVLDTIDYLTVRVGADSFNTYSSLFRVLREHSLTVFVLLIAAYSAKRVSGALRHFNVLLGGGFFLYSMIRHIIDNPNLSTAEWLQSAERDPHYTRFFVYFWLVSGTAALVSLTGRTLFPILRFHSRKMETNPSRIAFDALLIVLSVSLLVQIVPTWDIRHVWWASPLMTLVIVLEVSRQRNRHFSTRILALFPALSFVMILVYGSYETLSMHRIEHPPGLNSSGFLSDPWTVRDIRRDAVFLQAELSPDETYLPLVFNYDLVSLFGTYASSDQYFVRGQKSAPALPARLAKTDFVLLDHSPGLFPNDQAIFDAIELYPAKIEARSDHLVLLRVNR